MALDRGRDSENARSEAKKPTVGASSSSSWASKAAAAPQADTAVAPTAAFSQRHKPSVSAKRSTAQGSTAAGSGSASSVRLRNEQEVLVRDTPSAGDGGLRGERGAPLESAGDGGRQTPLKSTQRLPPSRRRPKTPHIDETARSSRQNVPASASLRGNTQGSAATMATDTGHDATSFQVPRLGVRLANAENARRAMASTTVAVTDTAASATSRAGPAGAHRRQVTPIDPVDDVVYPAPPVEVVSPRTIAWLQEGGSGTPEEQVEVNDASEHHAHSGFFSDGAVTRHTATDDVPYSSRTADGRNHVNRQINPEIDEPSTDCTGGASSCLDDPSPSPERAPRRRPVQKQLPFLRTTSTRRGDFEETLDPPDMPDIPSPRTYTASLSPRIRNSYVPVPSPRASNRTSSSSTVSTTDRRAPVSSPRASNRAGSGNTIPATDERVSAPSPRAGRRIGSGSTVPATDRRAARPAARKAGATVAPDKTSASSSGLEEYAGRDGAAAQEPQAMSLGQRSGKRDDGKTGEVRLRPQPSMRPAIAKRGEGRSGGGGLSNEGRVRQVDGMEYMPDAGGDLDEGEEVQVSSQRGRFFSMSSSIATEAAAEEEEEEDGDEDDNRDAAAGELAVRLISAHREDVRSALAAARKDMDLVSKADQDRHPTALIEYAKEVEGVLGERLAAAAKLRAALDSYVTMRQAAVTAAVVADRRQPSTRDGREGGREREIANTTRPGRRVVEA